MITHMASILPGFDGQLSRIRCFAHVLTLVAKCLIREFDATAGKEPDEAAIDEAELRGLAENQDAEEFVTQMENEAELDEDEAKKDDPDDEVDPMAELTDDKKKEFVRNVLPVKLVMAKVSSTILVFENIPEGVF